LPDSPGDVKQNVTFSPNNKFAHDWLPAVELNRVDSPTGRYYVTPEGNHYQSVTTFLSSMGHEYIEAWRAAVGAEEADKVSRRASSRGTTLHENAELYLRNNDVTINKMRMLDLSLMRGMVPILNRINNIKLLESQLYSDVLKLAGTVDCVADFDGIPSIIDFKTASKLKSKEEIHNYFMQVSIYSLMVEERYKVRIPRLVILISQEFGQPQVFIEERKNWLYQISVLLKLQK